MNNPVNGLGASPQLECWNLGKVEIPKCIIIMDNEIIIRVGSFLAVFIIIALGEIAARRRSLKTSKKVRWFSNIGITVINVLLVRLALFNHGNIRLPVKIDPYPASGSALYRRSGQAAHQSSLAKPCWL